MQNRLLFFLFFLVLGINQSFAQSSCAKIRINTYNEELSYTMFFIKEQDTLYEDSSLHDFYLELDSLIPGTYFIEIHSNDLLKEKIFSKKYELTAGDTSEISINLSLYEKKTGPNLPANEIEEDFDVQFTLAHHQNAWTEESDLFTNNFSAKFDYNFYHYKKHVAFASGGGYEYMRNRIKKDTSLFSNLPDTITKEFYHQFTLNFYAKIRFFSGKVTTKHYQPKLFLDLGLGYYFPIFKRHVAAIDNEFKYVEKHIGIPNDLRVFVNFGWHPVSLFASYRIFNSYQTGIPQATKYQFGITFSIAGE